MKPFETLPNRIGDRSKSIYWHRRTKINGRIEYKFNLFGYRWRTKFLRLGINMTRDQIAFHLKAARRQCRKQYRRFINQVINVGGYN